MKSEIFSYSIRHNSIIQKTCGQKRLDIICFFSEGIKMSGNDDTSPYFSYFVSIAFTFAVQLK